MRKLEETNPILDKLILYLVIVLGSGALNYWMNHLLYHVQMEFWKWLIVGSFLTFTYNCWWPELKSIHGYLVAMACLIQLLAWLQVVTVPLF